MITMHKTGTREEWLTARLGLLDAEKDLTRRSDELAQRRQELPWVRIDKKYRSTPTRGARRWRTSSADDRSCSSTTSCSVRTTRPGCPSCSAIADGFDGFVVHLANHDVTLGAVSRAPLAKLQAYKQRMGWSFPWASSFATDFNDDFNVRITEEQQRTGGVEYNYRREAPMKAPPRDQPAAAGPADVQAAMTGTDLATYTRERPGMSAFVLEDGVVYHTYSTYARGLDGLWGMFQWLDRAPAGRNETNVWWRRHDEYDQR